VAAVTTTRPAGTAPAHRPVWVDVKYRATPVDVADPRFTALTRTDSSLVDAAFYDAGNEYMVIVLNGTAYHYCDLPEKDWNAFINADSLGRFYRSAIKGKFDCRNRSVPQY